MSIRVFFPEIVALPVAVLVVSLILLFSPSARLGRSGGRPRHPRDSICASSTTISNRTIVVLWPSCM